MSLAIPCPHIKNYKQAVAFYIDFLNFKIDSDVKALFESDGWTALDLGSIVLGLHILPAGTAGIA